MVRTSRPPPKKIKIPKIGRKPAKKRVAVTKPTLSRKRVVKDAKKTTHKPQKSKKSIVFGTCYKEVGCKGQILLKRTSKANCKKIGGKSWKSSKICHSL